MAVEDVGVRLRLAGKQKFSGDLKGAAKDVRGLGDSAQESSKKAQKAGDGWKKFAKVAAGAAATAGAAVGAALVVGAMKAMDAGALTGKMTAQLNLTAAESQRIGGVAGELYAGAYGDSLAQVNDAVAAVVSSIDGMREASGDAIEDMTAKALNLSTAFGIDVQRAVQVVGQVVRTGLATDAAQGMDLLTASMQAMPAAVRGDLIDALDEYGPFMASLGLTGEKGFGLLVKGAEKGMFGIDKTGDALKEFINLSTDLGSKSVLGAYEAVGLNADDMANAVLSGGDAASAAFSDVVTGLLAIKDPAAQAEAAVALFGTPMEDMNKAEIPAFLDSLDATAGALGDVAGRADAFGDALNDNASTRLLEFRRTAEMAVVDFLGNQVIPMIERNKDAFINFGLIAAIVGLEITAGVLRVGEGFLRAFAFITEALSVVTVAVLDFTTWLLGAMAAALGWVPGWGDKLRTAQDAVAEFGDAAKTELSESSANMRKTADSAGAAAAQVDKMRNSIGQLRDKRVSITTVLATEDRRDASRAANFAARATGGPVQAGRPYIVGELRPEVFVPDVSGTILPRVPDTINRPGLRLASSSAPEGLTIGRDDFGGGPRVIHVPVYLDGRQIAEATADATADREARR